MKDNCTPENWLDEFNCAMEDLDAAKDQLRDAGYALDRVGMDKLASELIAVARKMSDSTATARKSIHAHLLKVADEHSALLLKAALAGAVGR
jgi:hypothetical protein